MAIWLVFAILTASVVLAIVLPIVRPSAPFEEGASGFEACKLQLNELARDEERGTIGREQAAEMRAEIWRRLLKAARQKNAAAFAANENVYNLNYAFMAIALVIGVGAIGLYSVFGTPGEPDQPLEARMNAPADQQTLGIQIANVERRLKANPQDLRGWSVLAPVYFRTEQFDKAANAFRKTIELGGETEERLYGLFESLNFANNGVPPSGSKAILDEALALNPKSLRGRMWLAIIADQDGRKADAAQIYRQMLSENLAPALKTVIAQRLAGLNNQPQAAEVPTAQAEDQGAMIRAMVERLAARLKENGGNLEDWLRLIRSYTVLKETEKAQETLASARKQFASEPQALQELDNFEQNLGLTMRETQGEQPK